MDTFQEVLMENHADLRVLARKLGQCAPKRGGAEDRKYESLFTVKELRNSSRKLGLRTTGVKRELVRRLRKFISKQSKWMRERKPGCTDKYFYGSVLAYLVFY